MPDAAYARPWRVAPNGLILGYELILTNRVTHPSRDRVLELLTAAARSSRRVGRRSPPYRAVVERAVDRATTSLVRALASGVAECGRVYGRSIDSLYGDASTPSVSMTSGELPAIIVDDIRAQEPWHRSVDLIRTALHELQILPGCGPRWQAYVFLESGVVPDGGPMRVAAWDCGDILELHADIDRTMQAFEPVLSSREHIRAMPSYSQEAISGYVADCVARMSSLVRAGVVRL